MNCLSSKAAVFISGLFCLLQISCRSDVVGPNRTPIAIAGANMVVALGDDANLDGSQSYDPEGGGLNFTWMMLSRPPQSNAVFRQQAENTSFAVDKQGLYVIGLVVTDDQQAESQMDVVQISTRNKRCTSASMCDDDQVCTNDTCVDGFCVNQAVADGTSCDDQLYCTVDDVCSSGICSGSERSCEGLAEACYKGVCNEDLDVCEKIPLPDLTPCDDEQWCTIQDSCESGVCTGLARDCGDQPAACLHNICNEQQQQCETVPVEDGLACDDGLFCTVGEKCQAGTCTNGTARDCSAGGGSCVDGTCDEQQGRCIGEPLPAGSQCDDELYCTIDDVCDGLGGCVGSTRPCTHLDSACTVGRCDEESATCVAQATNEGAACDDGQFCSDPDTCHNGVCSGPERNCAAVASDQCHQGVCNEDLNTCQETVKADGTDCDDGAYCTVQTTCQVGACVGVARDCSQVADQCNDPSCDETLDQCVPNPKESVACEDGLFCTLGDTCNAQGVCAPGSNTPCQDECNDVCDEQKRTCAPTPAGSSCIDDNIFCNGSSECDGEGNCVPTNISPCDETKCKHCQEAKKSCFDPADTPCPDQLFCNGSETCDGAGTCQPSSNPCPETICQHCQENTDSCQDPAGTTCEDGAFCTVNTTCLNGVCQGGQARDCQAEVADECNLAQCDEDNNQCEPVPIAPGTMCSGSDGEPCNSACNSTGQCIEGIMALDMQSCLGDSGICCQSVCQVDAICCDDTDCDNGNLCLTNSCQAGDCQSSCAESTCFILDLETELSIDTDNPVAIHSCQDNLDPSRFVCFSSRNHQGAFVDGFEQNLDSYSLSGDVSRQQVAQNPGSSGLYGVQLCGQGASLTYSFSRANIAQDDQVELSFWASNVSMGSDTLLHAEYKDEGQWYALVLFGANHNQPYQNYRGFIPSQGLDEDPISIRFTIKSTAGEGGPDECAFVDDLLIWKLLPASVQQMLFNVDFTNRDLGPFSIVDPQGNDVSINKLGTWEWLVIEDNANAQIVSENIDTTSVAAQDQLMLRFSWCELSDLVLGEYCQVEYSPDGGATFRLLAATGDQASYGQPRTQLIRLPCDASGIDNLRIRFICPDSSLTPNNDGIYLDDISLFVQQPEWVDAFSGFTNAGQGVYSSVLRSTTPGTASVICTHACSSQTNQVNLTFD